MQERSGRAKSGVRAGRGEAAPHPADHDQMRDKRGGKAQAQQAGWPREGAADGGKSLEDNERAAPDAEACGEPPQTTGRDSARGHGRARVHSIAMIVERISALSTGVASYKLQAWTIARR